jgi:hypothetical protein
VRNKKAFFLLILFLMLFTLGNQVYAEGEFSEMGNTITEEEKLIAKEFESEKEIVKGIIEKNLGERFMVDDILVNMEYDGLKSKIVINYKSENDDIKKLKQLINDSLVNSKVKFNKVKYDPSELKEYTLKIINYLKKNESAFTQISGLDPDVDKSIIYILTNENLDAEIKKDIQSIFQDVKFLKASKATRFNEEISRSKDYNKLGGGIRMIDSNFAGGCTANSVAKKGTSWFLITAGHCLNADNSIVSQNSLAVGTDHAQLDGRNLDIAVVRLYSTTAITRSASNYFYEYAENDTDYDKRFTGVSTASESDGVCKSGITTNVTCGVVTDSYYVDTCSSGCDVPVKIVTVASYSSESGDSGAPVYENYTDGRRTLAGIHSGRGTGEAEGLRIFTDIYEAEQEFSTTNAPFRIHTDSTVINIPRL